jgi:uncharacterized protein (DUF736 family)
LRPARWCSSRAREGDKAPSYRVVSPSKTGNVELGAAWKKRSEEGRDYLSVKLDDPSMAPAPVVRRSPPGAVRKGRPFTFSAYDK